MFEGLYYQIDKVQNPLKAVLKKGQMKYLDSNFGGDHNNTLNFKIKNCI